MKVLFITRAYPPVVGGMENFSYQLTSRLSERLEAKIVANRYGKRALPFFIPYALIKSLWLARDVDLVHLGDPVVSIVGYLLKKIYKLPVVVNLHGLDLLYPSLRYQKYFAKYGKDFDLYISISRETEKIAHKKGITKTTIIPVGIDAPKQLPLYGKRDIEKATGISVGDRPVLITVGRLIKRKGVRWFVRRVMPKLSPEVLYLVVGEGQRRELIERSIKKNGLEDRVKLLGRVDDKTLDILYSAADLFIMPNIRVKYDREGFGMVAAEAAVHGLTVVASGIEGIQDAIQDGKNGYLVPTGDINGFLTRINALLDDTKGRKAFGQQAKGYTMDRYGWEKVTDKYMQEFEALLRRLHLNK